MSPTVCQITYLSSTFLRTSSSVLSKSRKMKTLFCCIFTLTAILTNSAFAKPNPQEFLLQFGYLKEKTGANRAENPTPEEMQKAIIAFQRFTGLPQTGVMDDTTSQKMIAPRCGVKDVNGKLGEFRAVSKWPKKLITWKIHKYSTTSKLSPAEQKRAIRRGLKRWAQVTPLYFRETAGKPTLDISFEKKRHGDGHAFDGIGRVLAHAFFPRNGDTHFDDDEIWVNGGDTGTDLETVAAHEFGHALGLGHSTESRSLMAPFYQKFPDNFRLHSDDIAGIQKLYGKKSTKVTPRRTTPTRPTPRRTTPRRTTPRRTPTTRRTVTNRPTGGNGFCNHLYRKIDAAMRISGNDYVFVDNRYVINGQSGHKMDISRLFPGGPNMVQAAVYSQRSRKAYLFYNQNVWAYSLNSVGQFRLAPNYPKYITNSYGHNPESAMQFTFGSERLFLIKNGFFMEFDPYYENVAPGRGYRTRDFFANIPYEIDAAISSASEIYFIAKKKAYRMSMRERRVDIRGKPVNLAFNKCRN